MSDGTPPLRFEEFTLDRDEHRLLQAGQVVSLRPKTFAVLIYLIEHRQRVVPKDELLSTMWPGLKVETQGVFQSVSELRSAFRGHNFIRTVRGTGYQWTGEVSEVASCKEQHAAQTRRLHIIAASLATAIGFLWLATLAFESSELIPRREVAAAETEALIQQARTHLMDGELDAAEAYLWVILERNPRHLEAKLDLAMLYFERGQVTAARTLGSEVYQAAINNGTQHIRMASAVLMSRLPDEHPDSSAAWSYAREAVEIGARLRSPVYAAAGHERLGELYMAAGKTELAVFELNEALQNYYGSCPDAEQRVRSMLAELSPQA
jgi:DNA-binding winged helix-turn-helix (wHTH) protein